MGDRVVPAEAQPVVVDAVVRIAFPVAGEAEIVGRLLEAAVAHELGGQPAFDAFVHELEEVPVEAVLALAPRQPGAPEFIGLPPPSTAAWEGAQPTQPQGPPECL